MKPTKNRFFCNDCGKIKMLFETEKNADNFIKFNREEIEEETGDKPERSYYCIACAGWHITSKKELWTVKSKTEKIIEQYEAVQETKRKMHLERKKLQEEKKKQNERKKLEIEKIRKSEQQKLKTELKKHAEQQKLKKRAEQEELKAKITQHKHSEETEEIKPDEEVEQPALPQKVGSTPLPYGRRQTCKRIIEKIPKYMQFIESRLQSITVSIANIHKYSKKGMQLKILKKCKNTTKEAIEHLKLLNNNLLKMSAILTEEFSEIQLTKQLSDWQKQKIKFESTLKELQEKMNELQSSNMPPSH